jgi:hypothetical protein
VSTSPTSARPIFLPTLLARLNRIAPGVRIRTLPMPTEAAQDALKSGEVDLAIGNLPDFRAGFYQQRLFPDRYVCAVRRDHPQIGQRLTARQFAAASHAIAMPAGTGHGIILRTLMEHGLEHRIVLQVQNFLVLPNIVATTDLLAIVPHSVGSQLSRYNDIKLLPVPIPIPPFDIKQCWHERFHDDAGNRWLRQQFVEPLLAFDRPARPAYPVLSIDNTIPIQYYHRLDHRHGLVLVRRMPAIGELQQFDAGRVARRGPPQSPRPAPWCRIRRPRPGWPGWGSGYAAGSPRCSRRGNRDAARCRSSPGRSVDIAVVLAELGRQVGGLEGHLGRRDAADRDVLDEAMRRHDHQARHRMAGAGMQQRDRGAVGMADQHRVFDPSAASTSGRPPCPRGACSRCRRAPASRSDWP